MIYLLSSFNINLSLKIISGLVRGGASPSNALAFIHTLFSNINADIRGLYHGASNKHLNRYLAEFCYRFSRRFLVCQMFDRILAACVATNNVYYSGLQA